MTLDEQDRTVAKIVAIWPDAQVIDRRTTPSHGYRAVHIVPKIDGCLVEIQLRTIYQDVWAQAMEMFGDLWGRDIRYGGPPHDADTLEFPDTGYTRRMTVDAWKRTSDRFHELADMENRLADIKSHELTDEQRLRVEGIERETAEKFADVKELITTLRDRFRR